MHLDPANIIVPSNHRQATRSPEWIYWAAAEKSEIDGLCKAKCYRVEDVPKGAVVIDGKWVYAIKTNTI